MQYGIGWRLEQPSLKGEGEENHSHESYLKNISINRDKGHPTRYCTRWCNRPLDTRRTREYLGPSTVSLSVVHVAEREHSRMAAGSHFVNDEEERRAVATIFATLGIASRCHVITDSFFCEIPHHPNGPRPCCSPAFDEKSRTLVRIFNESPLIRWCQICRVLRGSKRAWKITHTIEFPKLIAAGNFAREETKNSEIITMIFLANFLYVLRTNN